MIEPRVVRRYAAALFAEADRAGVVDLVESDLGLISHSLETMSNLNDALVSPLIPTATKREIVTQIFRDKIQDITLYYLYLLIDKRREEVIRYTEEQFVQFANEARGITVAKVTSAIELTDQEISAMRSGLSSLTGKRVELELETDPTILGGVMVRIGDSVWDGSVTGYLARLREQLLSGQTPQEME